MQENVKSPLNCIIVFCAGTREREEAELHPLTTVYSTSNITLQTKEYKGNFMSGILI